MNQSSSPLTESTSLSSTSLSSTSLESTSVTTTSSTTVESEATSESTTNIMSSSSTAKIHDIPSSTSPGKDEKVNNMTLIICITVGVICFLVIAALTLCYWKKKRSQMHTSFSVMYERYFGVRLSQACADSRPIRNMDVASRIGSPNEDVEEIPSCSNDPSNVKDVRNGQRAERLEHSQIMYQTNYIILASLSGKPDEEVSHVHSEPSKEESSSSYSVVEVAHSESNFEDIHLNSLRDRVMFDGTGKPLQRFNPSNKSIESVTEERSFGSCKAYAQLADYTHPETPCKIKTPSPLIFSSQESQQSVFSDLSMSLRPESSVYYSEVNGPDGVDVPQEIAANPDLYFNTAVIQSDLMRLAYSPTSNNKVDSLSAKYMNLRSPSDSCQNKIKPQGHKEVENSLKDHDYSETSNDDYTGVKSNRASTESTFSYLYDNSLFYIHEENKPSLTSTDIVHPGVHSDISHHKPQSEHFVLNESKYGQHENPSFHDDEVAVSDTHNQNLSFGCYDNWPGSFHNRELKNDKIYSNIMSHEPGNKRFSNANHKIEIQKDSRGKSDPRESSSDIYDNNANISTMLTSLDNRK
ncbi:serine-rich adhesin for platelets [Biomphalaria glabrata]|nr:serine-rich adhesin for platelets [Biomphalaria glabrata]